MQAMILAAGFGTRLLPHTRLRPKPLFPILDTPLLLLIIKHLLSLGFTRIVVNCHYLAEQIEAAVAPYVPFGVIVQNEEKVLGTGGGLRRAMRYFSDDPVLVTNGDIYHTIDLLRLYRHHLRQEKRVTLAMHDSPRFNTVFCDGDSVCHFAENSGAGEPIKLAYTGVQIITPSVLNGICPDSFSCIISHYRNLLAQGEELGCFRVDDDPGFFWTDIGTPEDYLQLHGGLLQGKVPCWPELKKPDGPFFIAKDVDMTAAAVQDWVMIGSGVSLGRGCSICRSVLWDNQKIGAGVEVKERLVSGAAEEIREGR